MKCALHRLMFGTVCYLVCFPLLSTAQTPITSSSESSLSSAHPAKRVRANQNLDAFRQAGRNAVSSASDRPSREPRSFSNGATFVNPKPGQIFHPGETIHIDLDVDPSIIPVKAIGIISPVAYSNESRSGPPYSFTLTLPDQDTWGQRLIGFQELTLFGTVVGRNDYAFAGVTVDVEEAVLPISLTVASPSMSQYDRIPNHLSVGDLGEEEIAIYAKFPNHSERETNVTGSTHLTLVSEAPAVATVSDDGTVTSTAPGQTRIVATYTVGTERKILYIPVTVEVSKKDRSTK
jgi:hypothetical protein